ncbi:alpha/beta hydrolase [Bifidobacterium sp. ESL0763]|uniref:alpha/beta fold hydrolase n=1 Tax=Bifidobacterium sp. ESL0763 TaxID=2983227 RepID=UPI0023F8C2B2|nr:alpha/beta hydrolase [Bifidobacterium sp. ESL0763]MDF7663165.1 alpha/beta hydrolase [Bifidobacterium sp. ESL0763]
MRIPLIDEDHYDEAMRETVLPALAKCRVEGWMAPAGVADDDVVSNSAPADGAKDVERAAGDSGIADEANAESANDANVGRPDAGRASFDSASADGDGDAAHVGIKNAKAGAGMEGTGAGVCEPGIGTGIGINDGQPAPLTNNTLFGISSLPAPPTPGDLHYVCFDAHRFDSLNVPGASAKFRGSIVFSFGFTEFAAKHAEMTWYFLLAGYSVCILEHRGHGYSVRDVDNPSLVWIDDWRRYVADLAKFARTVGRQYAGDESMHLYAHSMGGGIGAAALECYPMLFDRAVLSSPMIEPITGMPNAIAGPATALAGAVGLSRRRAPGQSEFSPTMRLKGYEGAQQSRVRWYFERRLHDRHYQTNAATFGWVNQALRMSRAILWREACSRIDTPILLFQAGRDTWVHNAAQNRFVDRVRLESGDVVLERVEPAVHEIFSMPNAVLGPYVERIIDFYAESVDEMVADAE